MSVLVCSIPQRPPMNIVLITTVRAALVLPNPGSYHPIQLLQLLTAIHTRTCVTISRVLPQTNATL
jgi:hypothetical protein